MDRKAPAMPKRYFVQRHLSFAFGRLGASVGKHPLLYFLLPFAIAVGLSIRIYWVSVAKEVEYLYSPINARFHKEREAIKSIFPPSSSAGLSPIYKTDFPRMATVLLEAKDGGTVLKEEVFKEVARVDDLVHNITVFLRSKNYNYEDLCSKQRSGECQTNDVLNLVEKVEDIKRKWLRIKYPIHVDTISQCVEIYGVGLGGVTTDEEDYVVDAKAVRLIYTLNDTTEELDAAGYDWELSFHRVLLNSRFRNIKVSVATSQSIDIEFSRITEMALPLIKYAAPLMLIFATASCMTTNWITSKPWVAIAGCASPLIATAAAFGFLLLCGLEYVELNLVILFLMVGIGLDDSFVMLAAWRRTDPGKEVPTRMKETYEEAAMSITITSVTNLLTLCVGATIPYRVVRLYCCYAAMSVAFAYIYQITFVGGVLALSGLREKRKMHPLLFITLKEEHTPRSFLIKFLYFGCENVDKEDEKNNNCKLALKDRFLVFITSGWGKGIVAAAFIAYITTSAYSLTFLHEGFDYRDGAPYDSYLVDYLNTHYKHFTRYPHTIQVAINKTLDYSSKEVQRNVEDIMESICNLPDMAGNKCKVSWLDYYLQSTEWSLLRLSYRGYNLSDPEDFISGLKDVFLKLPHGRFFRPLVKFNHNETQIVASRFIAVSANVGTYEKEKRLLSTLLSKIGSFKYPVHIYNIWFSLYSIFLEINSSAIETIFSAVITVVVVFFIFVPHFVCLVGIMLTIASIQVGVVGYMSVLGVPLNPVSMICLVISAGLSVDYAAHICYAYLCCKEEDPNEKTKVALRHAGYPIIQGCLSTILGVLVLGFGPSDIFLVFFKVITLVMLIAGFHGLIVIPVMLNVLEAGWKGLAPRLLSKRQASKDVDRMMKESLFRSTENHQNVSSSCT